MNFQLTPWKKEYLKSLVHYANNIKIAMFLRDGFPHPYTMEHGQAFIEMALKNTPPNILAIVIVSS